MIPETPRGIDRRTFLRRAGLVGGTGALLMAGPALLGACGGSSSKVDTLSLSDDPDARNLVGLFNYSGDYLVSTIPQRLPFAIATPEGPPAIEGPPTLTVQLRRAEADIGDPIVLERHADGTPIPYYPLVTTFDETGVWSITTELDGQMSSQSFMVQAPDTVGLRQVGQAMVPVDSPTPAATRGVDPICTRAPACPLHDRPLGEVLADGTPVALLISTPQFCQTGVCGPVLDTLLEFRDQFPGITFVHAEVYNQPNNGGDPAALGVTDSVRAYGLSFEPSLFVARADGTITARLDNIFDRGELQAALAAVS
ncbi:MAG: hypothetical protein KGR18_02605 [Acidobacteria bacterium]|nr:hypothetical protein [Acidobacteriota bacterium]